MHNNTMLNDTMLFNEIIIERYYNIYGSSTNFKMEKSSYTTKPYFQEKGINN